ncbi:tetratricopeptide repeat protein [Zhouia sp. PK063]|uniref:tetratricopeptide repeat protein n=1 Tax=Zhouia sp. PK063 TaxID=3373602 RepID=UPI003798D403
MKKLLSIVFVFVAYFSFAQNDTLFTKANTAYNNAKYQDAINDYLQINKNGVESAELYFNLGNAYYKINKIAPSIYYYQKALKLDPGNQDIKNNLAFANNMTIDAIDANPDSGLSASANKLIGTFTYNTWGIIAIVFIFGFIALFLLYYFTGHHTKKRIFFATGIIALLLCIISVCFGFHEKSEVKSNRQAIIFQKEVAVKAEPNNHSSEAFTLHEGTKVKITSSLNNWRQIELADGKTGWLTQSTIKEF